ncbi:hypothetical protein V2A60_007545 [Cordyceps javanica]|uniref:Soluble quinoprotein glucose/sorbosone dehydrogenase n=1 Tax=Cordyceps javanica TaxID=43265 RepID=A0A545W7I6_9HYPO|nr:Soluble quinoprotein glucose/sorbosone dehydrogenase [Cordyceps javanica]TQW09961.1 Soluble quinoprotein glucose/sorbosone dehydrogenase [Cordyceps javanica]
MPLSRVFVFAMLAGAALADVACPGPAPKASPLAAKGVSWKVLTNQVSHPRQIVQDALGNLLVTEGKGVRRLELDKAEGLDLCIKNTTQLITDPTLNHGLALTADGKTLFASSSTDVYAYTYDAATGTAGPARSVISGMKQTGHVSRTLYVPPENPDLLLVLRGSNDNVDKDTARIESGRSQLRVFQIDDLLGSKQAVDYTEGDVMGWGLRNSVGVGQDPTTGHIWTVENSIDNMHRFGDDIHNSNPGEELNFHGRPNDTEGYHYGRNFGYPGCLSVFDPTNVKDYANGTREPEVGAQFAGDFLPQYTDLWCRRHATPPRITFGSHLAPLDIKFLHDGSAALISFHGSWNRQPPNGYRLSRVSFANGNPVKRAQEADAEEMLLWNSNNADCRRNCFRPVGLLLDKQSRLFMTSDATGELFLVTGTHNKGVTANP